MIKVCVTGAAGQIAYSFIPLLLSGQVFGDKTISLRLLDIPQMENVLKGVEMEIHDCAYPLLDSVQIGSDPLILFKEADLIVFLGGFPRKPGMERKDLLQVNAKIFQAQGQALNEVGKADTKCLVIANPANTNCMILSRNAPKIPKQNFTCLTRLDQNRAYSYIAQKLNKPIGAIKNVIIWGNHSTTQYPSVEHGSVNNQLIELDDMETYITRIQKRGEEVLKARGNSSVFSAANAVKDHLKDWYFGKEDTMLSMGVISSGEYGIPEGLCFSFPVKCKGNYQWEVVKDLELSGYSRERIEVSMKELMDERADSQLQ